MNDNGTKTYAGIAWGLIFLLLGVLMAVPGDQNGVFLLGAGTILIGLNVLRRLRHIPVHLFSTILGGLAFMGGAYALARPALDLPRIQVGFLPLMLMVIGLYILIPGPGRADS